MFNFEKLKENRRKKKRGHRVMLEGKFHENTCLLFLTCPCCLSFSPVSVFARHRLYKIVQSGRHEVESPCPLIRMKTCVQYLFVCHGDKTLICLKVKCNCISLSLECEIARFV